MYNESISTNNLTIGYPNTRGGEPTIIQRNLSFSLHAGEMVCMLGPNGCGKSTLLRTLAGLQEAVSSEKGVMSSEYGVQSNENKIALVLTERLSMENTTVHDVVALGRYPYTSFLDGLSADDERIIAESLEQVGVPPHEMHTFFNAHSDGEKQRILIAKALAQQTPIILLDEPTAHLDLPHRILILRLLRRLAHEQGKTILISTHELELALALSDRILLMFPKGQGVRLDTADKLRAEDAFTQAFGMDVFGKY
ncbi:MAG: ABC transporter ATP-binding protein [Paludibacteraceae bacterium]|nr:ABC transporter ATP-binding protein [Paludibacteraceae bacterium]